MFTVSDKRDRAALFRGRLREAIALRATSQSALARAAGVDRSTISQLLGSDMPRLPGGQLVAAMAGALGVSSDWLLALSDRPETAADVLAASVTVAEAPRALIDEHIFGWYQEAAGYKIRHVPTSFPDLLKTEAVMRWEYAPHLGRTTDQAIGASRDRLHWMRNSASDYEIAMPLFEIDSLARGEGYYRGLPRQIRLAQVDRILELAEQLFPRLRMTLFDARRVYSVPITVFGPLIAVIYLGQTYMVFRDSDKVSLLAAHFDALIREAAVGERAFGEHLRGLRAGI